MSVPLFVVLLPCLSIFHDGKNVPITSKVICVAILH